MDDSAPYPMDERPIALPSGGSVTLYNVIIFRGPQGSSIGLQYRTAIPSSASEARQAEAAEVIALAGTPLADREQARRASAQICNTPAAAAMRETPEQTFCFERDAGGAWHYTDQPSPPPWRPTM